MAVSDSPVSDMGPPVDAPFWNQPVIQDYIKQHSQHGSACCGVTGSAKPSGAAGAQPCGGAGGGTEAEPRIRTVKMRGAYAK